MIENTVIEYIPFVYPLLGGVLLGAIGLQAYLSFRRNVKVRTLRALVRGVNLLARVTDGDEDPVGPAKREAEEAALKDRLQAAVAKL